MNMFPHRYRVKATGAEFSLPPNLAAGLWFLQSNERSAFQVYPPMEPNIHRRSRPDRTWTWEQFEASFKASRRARSKNISRDKWQEKAARRRARRALPSTGAWRTEVSERMERSIRRAYARENAR